MSRYGDINYFMSQDFSDGIETIKEALLQRNRKESWELYLTKYGQMTKEDYVPFDTFWERPKTPKEIAREKVKAEKKRKINKASRERYAVNAITLAEEIKQAYMKNNTNKNP